MDSKYIYDFLIKVQSIAKIGLVCSKDEYALTNYNEINDLSRDFLEDFENVKFDRNNYFERDVYPTPNVSVRSVIFNEARDKVLMVREANTHTYSLPGGWCDLYNSPAETAKMECMQEAGAEIEIVRLVGITNRTPFKQATSVPEYAIIFEAKVVGELHEHEYETDEVSWIDIHNIPASHKVSNEEIDRFIKAALSGETIYD
ncbi:MAG: NUDIX hydrolase N-terminal domain-containing protein [Coprobacillus sp.]|nr:NUDIX hydrolase N-terminal domain-containing protein [Coprobacillus sp.]